MSRKPRKRGRPPSKLYQEVVQGLQRGKIYLVTLSQLRALQPYLSRLRAAGKHITIAYELGDPTQSRWILPDHITLLWGSIIDIRHKQRRDPPTLL